MILLSAKVISTPAITRKHPIVYPQAGPLGGLSRNTSGTER
jgi:hypothetical protein